MQKGDSVRVKAETHAWYSGYGANPVRIISTDETLTVQSVNVPAVRAIPGKPRSYNVARTEDGWQISTCEVEFVSARSRRATGCRHFEPYTGETIVRKDGGDDA